MVVIKNIQNGIGSIQINRPHVLNSINLEVVQRVQQLLKKWKEDDQIKAVYLYGAGDRSFCAGGDMRTFYNLKENEEDVNEYARNFFNTEYDLDYIIHTYPKPVIVYMDGIVMGGGVGLSIGASVRIVTEKTKWAMPEMNIGFFPDVGASYFLNKMPGYIGRYIALTAQVLNAEDVLYIGAADYIVHTSKWPSIWEKMIQLAKDDSFSINDIKKYVEQEAIPVSDNLHLPIMKEKINTHFQYNTIEEIASSLQEAATGGDEWAQEVLHTLLTKSPLSLKVALQQLIKGENKSLKECFEMEKKMALQFMKSDDFYEGVRAVLVDKDHVPRWNPKKIEAVKEADVQSFFNYT